MAKRGPKKVYEGADEGVRITVYVGDRNFEKLDQAADREGSRSRVINRLLGEMAGEAPKGYHLKPENEAFLRQYAARTGHSEERVLDFLVEQLRKQVTSSP